jgi:hypothetical protein
LLRITTVKDWGAWLGSARAEAELLRQLPSESLDAQLERADAISDTLCRGV